MHRLRKQADGALCDVDLPQGELNEMQGREHHHDFEKIQSASILKANAQRDFTRAGLGKGTSCPAEGLGKSPCIGRRGFLALPDVKAREIVALDGIELLGIKHAPVHALCFPIEGFDLELGPGAWRQIGGAALDLIGLKVNPAFLVPSDNEIRCHHDVAAFDIGMNEVQLLADALDRLYTAVSSL